MQLKRRPLCDGNKVISSSMVVEIATQAGSELNPHPGPWLIYLYFFLWSPQYVLSFRLEDGVFLCVAPFFSLAHLLFSLFFSLSLIPRSQVYEL